LIDAAGSIDKVSSVILKELEYQSSNELGSFFLMLRKKKLMQNI